MYQSHPVFIEPENEEVKVWRYMDFTKFVSLIDTKRLYFTRADRFEDPFEGSWPKKNIEARKYAPEILDEQQKEYLNGMKWMGSLNKNWPRYTAINCWHENEYESAAMWKLYLKSDEGIAIKSTYSRLKKSIIDDEIFFIGKVNYIDYEVDYIDPTNFLGPFVHKRKSFEHEKEIRAVIMKWPTIDGKMDFSKVTIINGLPIKVDVETLIDKIYVSPTAPKWFMDLVSAVVRRYGYDFDIIQSELYYSPIF